MIAFADRLWDVPTESPDVTRLHVSHARNHKTWALNWDVRSRKTRTFRWEFPPQLHIQLCPPFLCGSQIEVTQKDLLWLVWNKVSGDARWGLWAQFNEYCEAQGSHDEIYTDGSKMDESVMAAAVINHHFQDAETTCRQLSKRLPDNSTIFAAEATAITLALYYYRHMGPVHHNVVVYSDSMSCLQAIEGKHTDNPCICHCGI